MINLTETRGGLKPALISEVDNKGIPVPGGLSIPCMFNPYEYSVSQTNSFKENEGAGVKNKKEIQKAGTQTLSLKLTFDTYEDGTDVTLVTRQLWRLMQLQSGPTLISLFQKQKSKPQVPFVAFQWGVFRFVSLIQSMTQKFTLFDIAGTPLRAQVDVKFVQHDDVEDYVNQPQNPTSGGGPIHSVWSVKADDRLDNIAATVYDDPNKWRLIAGYNKIVNPFALRPGQQLLIPLEQVQHNHE